MNDNDQKSFETVDLLSPIEMLPIQGVDSTLGDTDINNEITPVLPDLTNNLNTGGSGQSDFNIENISSQNSVIKEGSSNDNINIYNDNNSLYSNTNNIVNDQNNNQFNNQYNDGYNNQYNNQYSNQFNKNQYSNPNYNQHVLSPEEIFHRENANRRRFGDTNRKRDVMVISIVVFAAFMIFIFSMLRGKIRRITTENYSQEIPKKTIENSSDLPISDLIMQDETYGILSMDSTKGLDSTYVSVSPEIIEYTGLYERSLYFKVTPKDDNVSVYISVEMIDGNGESMGTVVGTGMGIPKDREGLIPVSFSISPYMDFNNITYNISVESRKSSGKIIKRDISDIKVEDGKLYVSVSGEKNLDKYAYMVFYKNNNVVKVVWKAMYIEGAETVVLEFDTNDIDFDSSQIYY